MGSIHLIPAMHDGRVPVDVSNAEAPLVGQAAMTTRTQVKFQ